MPKQEKRFKHFITDADRVTTRIVKDKNSILVFSVRYHALIKGKWRLITAFDNSHSSIPHRHVYYPDQPEYKYTMIKPDPNEALTEAQFTIKKNFQEMRERYILLLEKDGGGKL